MQQLTHTNNGFNTRPLYMQLRDNLADKISKGEWKPGHQLPNEHDLAVDFGVSSGTMRKALDMLEREGFLVRKQGRGTIVLDKRALDQERRLACTRKSLHILKEAVADAGQSTTPKLQSSLQSHIAQALFEAGYSGETT